MKNNAETQTDAGPVGLRNIAVSELPADTGRAVAPVSKLGVAVEREDGGIAVASETSALISMIERAARDPSVDLDKMERLFAMKERMEDRRNEAAFNAAMAAAQAEIAPVIVNKRNDHTGNTYADLFAIADTALPVISRHGFGLTFSQFKSDQPNCIGVECRVKHARGHSEIYRFDVPTDSAGSQGKVNKTATQALGSTLTYGRRYAIINVFNIAITDNDGNKAAANTAPVTEQEIADFREALKAKNVKEGEVCQLFSVENLDDLTRKQFDAAVKRLANTKVRK